MIISNLQEFYSKLVKGTPIIAIDYGVKKIGIALSNQEHTFAMPLKVISSNGKTQQINEILNLITIYTPCAFVLGLPINMNCEESEQTKIVRNFAAKLAKIVNLPLYLQDERLTSKAADSFLKSIGVKRKDRNAQDNKIAASMILQDTIHSIKNLQSSKKHR